MADEWVALSIRQPWVDLILRGIKTIEVREWHVERRGPILIHAARALDWRSVELFGYDNPLSLPRGGLLGYAEIADVIVLSPDRWVEHRDSHCVLHARRPVQYGAVLRNVRTFDRLIRCLGKRRFFPIPQSIVAPTRRALGRAGISTPGDSAAGRNRSDSS
jgi:hypothetical protein